MVTNPRGRSGRRNGRPPAGRNGEPTSTYPQLSARIPPETYAILRALAMVQRRPMWQVVEDAITQHHVESPAEPFAVVARRQLEQISSSARQAFHPSGDEH